MCKATAKSFGSVDSFTTLMHRPNSRGVQGYSQRFGSVDSFTTLLHSPNSRGAQGCSQEVWISRLFHNLTAQPERQGRTRLQPRGLDCLAVWMISQRCTAACTCIYKCPLAHGLLKKMAAISQTTFSNAFSWKKSFVFWFDVQLTLSQDWFW